MGPTTSYQRYAMLALVSSVPSRRWSEHGPLQLGPVADPKLVGWSGVEWSVGLLAGGRDGWLLLLSLRRASLPFFVLSVYVYGR